MHVFSISAIARAAGVGEATIRDWLGREVLLASIRPSQGHGTEILFSFHDAVVASIVGTLRRNGLSLDSLKMVATELYRVEKSWSMVAPYMVVGKDRAWFSDEGEIFAKMGKNVVLLVMDVKKAEQCLRALLEQGRDAPARSRKAAKK
jgi:hypothetical protein